ncbi:Acetoin dehydrogenase operon transcriptional activator AcoR [Pelotomaculum schinkii]|uniref:Acetoin dehydrogenase operon transcriptional activator AcoR n=1 Tax=Pelotomaculum schinkii TaxID=78350 RepID=A0A4Y7RI33_9FIRM|nr:sigma 54-interacting transcriptional regulator [Pelotomaculum schinkii]TEB08420.1 Acetoin dehydrogenase operon transcriptional activator AcoR [Pelotomaculum schinkii]
MHNKDELTPRWTCEDEELLEKQLAEYKTFLDTLAKIKEDWEIFIHTGKMGKIRHVRTEVLSGWKRSMKRGIDPYKLYPVSLTAKNLELRLAENKEFIDIASPFLDALTLNLEGSGFRVDLLDKDLYILKQFGEPEVLETARKQKSYPGVSRSEQNTGCNAINLAAVLGRPVQLAGPEHYNAQLQYWTCSATPIFDPNGVMLGVVNIAGHYLKVHQHTLGMTTALGKAIEFSLRQNQLRKEKELAGKYVERMINSIFDGMIALDGQGLITFINRTAGEILEVKPQEVVNQPAELVLGSQSSIVEALRTGETYLNKELILNKRNKQKIVFGNVVPITDNNKVNGVLAVFKGLSHARGLVKNMAGFKAYFNFEDLKGNGAHFNQVINLARQAAPLPSNILILGESGTGKEMFAQAIHNASSVNSGPFVGINCAAIPAELIESELFGYEGGSFTGARREGQQGKFQLAAGGTLFLDEVNAMSVTMQAKLLRVLQNLRFTRIGGMNEIALQARIIAASNSDLWDEVSCGNFREDLFYRLNVITIEIPPLRERKDELADLIEHFCRKHAKKLNFNFNISERALEIMKEYHWPGNVRELENVIERCAVLAFSRSDSCANEQDLLSYPGIRKALGNRPEPSAEPLLSDGSNLKAMEKDIIKEVLNQTNGNITRAAKLLGITRKTLYRKMNKHALRA